MNDKIRNPNEEISIAAMATDDRCHCLSGFVIRHSSFIQGFGFRHSNWIAIVVVMFAARWCPSQTIAPPTLSQKSFLTLPGDQWKLLWNDEFNSDHLDTSKWTSGLSWSGDDGSFRHHNREYASYITDDNITFQSGNLALLTQRQDMTNPRGNIYHYTQAFIQTSGKFEYTYGYCEVRVKVPAEAGPGLWPAFWMLTKGWPPEDDVAEFWTGRPAPHTHQGFAYRDTAGKVQWDSTHKDSILQGFHTFGMEWGPGYQLFNRDGTITNASYGKKIPDVPMYVILNSGVASTPAPTSRTIFPNAFLVDYVRVYARPAVLAAQNLGFESEFPSVWTTMSGAIIVNSNAHSGQHALRLAAPSSSAEQTVFGLKRSTRYHLTAWANPTAGSQARLGVKDFGAPDIAATENIAGYKPISLDFTTGSSSTTAIIYCSKTSGRGPVFFDDFTITQSPHKDDAH